MTLEKCVSRRAVIAAGIAGGSSLLLPVGAVWPAGATRVVVETTAGKIRGHANDGVVSFKGVPYGASASGPKRFQVAAKAAPWKGVRDTFNYGPMAVQYESPPPAANAPVSFWNGALIPTEMSENCLVLNVWAPHSADRSKKRPVMVWLHGGGFFAGTAASAWTDGSNLARAEDVVVVSVNHRLNIFGHLYLDELAGEAFAGSGNAGMLDIVLALQWVRDNITEFGGNPGNVTIFGESGGGGKVSALMSMPAAKGLFQRAIIQSGPNMRVMTQEEGVELTHDVLKELGISPANAWKLPTIPPKAVFAAYKTLTDAAGKASWLGVLSWWNKMFAPIVDGKTLPEQPLAPAVLSLSRHVPLLIGTNADEYDAFGPVLSSAEVYRRLQDFVPDRADAGRLIDQVKARHALARDGEAFNTIISEAFYRGGSNRLAEAKIGEGDAPVFMYLLKAGVSRKGGPPKAYHGVDIPFVFNTVSAAPGELSSGLTTNGQPLAALMSKAWTTFARNGNLHGPGVPIWPAYDPQARSTMVFDAESRAVDDPTQEDRIAVQNIRL